MKPVLDGIHHAAFRCRDAAETTAFYERVLGMKLVTCFAEDTVPSTGEYDPYMHIFLDCGGSNILAFFELPEQKPMGRDENTPEWVQHLAFRTSSVEQLEAFKTRALAEGLNVLGPTNHGIFRSIYFFDPNGHRIEVACDTGSGPVYAELERLAPIMLEEWTRTKKAPKHAQWLHQDAE